jgi:hypothetical protein
MVSRNVVAWYHERDEPIGWVPSLPIIENMKGRYDVAIGYNTETATPPDFVLGWAHFPLLSGFRSRKPIAKNGDNGLSDSWYRGN